MNSKSEFVLNFAGFANWPREWKDWLLEINSKLPEAPIILFESDARDPELQKVRSLHAFSNTEDLLNWILKSTDLVVNLLPSFEPAVCPVPSLLILPVFRPSQFWSLDMPNSLQINGDSLGELGLRPSLMISNSQDLLDLLRHSSGRSSSQFIQDSLKNITHDQILKWGSLARKDFQAMETKKPLVSIVTPSFNQAQFLERTLNSVFTQDYPEIEYFVIDGGSTDGTIEVLNQYQGKLRWVSEKDSGYPEAVNKGFLKCQGKYLMWLPSDDMLYSPKSVSALVSAAEANDADVVFGEAFYIDDHDRFLGSYRTMSYTPENLKDWCLICQPATLFRADTFNRVGGLNQSFRCISDYDLWLRLSDAGAKFHRVGMPISCYRIHGESLTVKQKNISYREIFDLQLSRYRAVSRSWVMGAFKEVVLHQNLKVKWKGTKSVETSKSILRFSIVKKLIRALLETYFVNTPSFQRFIRRQIEPREPIWSREK